MVGPIIFSLSVYYSSLIGTLILANYCCSFLFVCFFDIGLFLIIPETVKGHFIPDHLWPPMTRSVFLNFASCIPVLQIWAQAKFQSPVPKNDGNLNEGILMLMFPLALSKLCYSLFGQWQCRGYQDEMFYFDSLPFVESESEISTIFKQSQTFIQSEFVFQIAKGLLQIHWNSELWWRFKMMQEIISQIQRVKCQCLQLDR